MSRNTFDSSVLLSNVLIDSSVKGILRYKLNYLLGLAKDSFRLVRHVSVSIFRNL